MSNKSALLLYDCLVPKVKELNLRCGNCQLLREKAGLVEPPITEQEHNEVFEFWRINAIEADNVNLADQVE